PRSREKHPASQHRRRPEGHSAGHRPDAFEAGHVLPRGHPYSYYRPLVHVLHTLRLVATAMRAPGPVVVHDPATGALTRTAFVVLGVLTGRSRHLLWIDCTAHEALAGQHHRGRVLPRWSFARHVRNAARF